MPRNKILLKSQEEPEIRRAIDDAELALYQDNRRTELYKLKEELLFTIEEKSSEADLSEMGRKFLNPSDPDNFVLPDLITLNHDIDADPSLSEEDKLRRNRKCRPPTTNRTSASTIFPSSSAPTASTKRMSNTLSRTTRS